MEKLILSKDKVRFMNVNEVLEEFRPAAYQLFKKYSNYTEINEDDIQELDIVIFRAFQSYDEKHCFSTHLSWQIRGYITKNIRAFKKTMYGQGIEVIDLDYVVEDCSALHDIIGDDRVNIEFDLIQNDLVRYIKDKSNYIEKGLIDVYLGRITMQDLSMKINKTPQSVSMASAKFKKRLTGLMKRYDRNLFNM